MSSSSDRSIDSIAKQNNNHRTWGDEHMFETSIYIQTLYYFFILLMVDTPFFHVFSFQHVSLLPISKADDGMSLFQPTRSIHKIQSRFSFRSKEIIYTPCAWVRVETKAVKIHVVTRVRSTILGIRTSEVLNRETLIFNVARMKTIFLARKISRESRVLCVYHLYQVCGASNGLGWMINRNRQH